MVFMRSPLRSHLFLSILEICTMSYKDTGYPHQSLCSQLGWEIKPMLVYFCYKKIGKKPRKHLSHDSQPCPDILPLLPPSTPWGDFLPPIGLDTGCLSFTSEPTKTRMPKELLALNAFTVFFLTKRYSHNFMEKMHAGRGGFDFLNAEIVNLPCRI